MALDILIVDDERDIRDLVSGVLSDEGYECRTAGDSTAALNAIDERRPSLVLLDVWKNLSVPCFEAVYPRLAEEGVIVSDNMIYPEGARDAVRALRAAIRAKGDLQTALLPLGSGIELTVKWSPGNAKL